MLLIRHGPVKSKFQGKILGRLDPPLDRLVRNKQSVESLDKLFQLENVRYISSPLQRCLETADLFNALDLHTDDRLVEMDLGVMQGKMSNMENYQKLMELEKEPDVNWHEGETVSKFFTRVKSFYEETLSYDKENNVESIVFTHSGVMRTIVSKILKWKPISWEPNYLEIIRISPDESLESINIQSTQVTIPTS